MVDLVTVAYVVAFFVLFVGSMLYLTWRSMGSEVHSPSGGETVEADDAAEAAE